MPILRNKKANFLFFVAIFLSAFLGASENHFHPTILNPIDEDLETVMVGERSIKKLLSLSPSEEELLVYRSKETIAREINSPKIINTIHHAAYIQEFSTGEPIENLYVFKTQGAAITGEKETHVMAYDSGLMWFFFSTERPFCPFKDKRLTLLAVLSEEEIAKINTATGKDTSGRVICGEGSTRG